jgi:hypothetical protein
MIKRAKTHAPWVQSGKCHLCLYPKIEIKVELYMYKVLGIWLKHNLKDKDFEFGHIQRLKFPTICTQ